MGRVICRIKLAVLLSLASFCISIYLYKFETINEKLRMMKKESYSHYKIAGVLKNVSICVEVIDGNETVIQSLPKVPIKTKEELLQERIKHGCWTFIDYYGFNSDWNAISNEEKNYPIAYSILAHHNTEQLILLLAQIYAPQNVYCVHIDKKSPKSMLDTFKLVQRCFPNVFLVSNQVDVWYASFSRLQADLNCMEDLLKSPIRWKHLINLCGQVRIIRDGRVHVLPRPRIYPFTRRKFSLVKNIS